MGMRVQVESICLLVVTVRMLGHEWRCGPPGPPRSTWSMQTWHKSPLGAFTVHLAVSVAGASTLDPARTGDPRGCLGGKDLNATNGPVAHLLIDGPAQGGHEQSHLGRPGRGVRLERELTLVKSHGFDMRGDIGSHDVGPLLHQACHGDAIVPAMVCEQALHACADQLRIAADSRTAFTVCR